MPDLSLIVDALYELETDRYFVQPWRYCFSPLQSIMSRFQTPIQDNW